MIGREADRTQTELVLPWNEMDCLPSIARNFDSCVDSGEKLYLNEHGPIDSRQTHENSVAIYQQNERIADRMERELQVERQRIEQTEQIERLSQLVIQMLRRQLDE